MNETNLHRNNFSDALKENEDPLGRSPLQVGIEVTIAVLICVACIVGNSLVVVAIHRTPRLNTITNMLVENLAWTDISMATLHLPFWIASMYSGRWLLGHMACRFVGFFELVFGTASLQTMAGIAINRYFSIVKRNLYTKYFSDRKTTYVIIITSWIIPVFVCSPPLYGWGTIEFSDKFTDCTMGWSMQDISYIAFLLTVAILITMIIIICCYFAIFRFVRRSSRQIQNHIQSESRNNQHITMGTTKRETKIIKVFVAVVCVYALCWTPVCIVGIFEIIGRAASRFVYIIVYYMMFSSSFCNPIIYGAFNPQFKEAFKQVYNTLNMTSETNSAAERSHPLGEGLVLTRRMDLPEGVLERNQQNV
ncbi:rhodopsin, GQ-coupled-like [Oculina patagonica]